MVDTHEIFVVYESKIAVQWGMDFVSARTFLEVQYKTIGELFDSLAGGIIHIVVKSSEEAVGINVLNIDQLLMPERFIDVEPLGERDKPVDEQEAEFAIDATLTVAEFFRKIQIMIQKYPEFSRYVLNVVGTDDGEVPTTFAAAA